MFGALALARLALVLCWAFACAPVYGACGVLPAPRPCEVHTYFVSEAEDDPAVWVHNAGCGDAANLSARERRMRKALASEGITVPDAAGRLRSNQISGEIGETMSLGLAPGYRPVGLQVPVRTRSGRVTIFDTVEANDSGRLLLIESKKGARADLNPNQVAAHEELRQYGGEILRSYKGREGPIAWGEGIEPGPIKPGQFDVRVDFWE